MAQLHRTADWLRSLPLARLEREDGAVAAAARHLIGSVNDLVVEICRAVPSTHCPPAGAVPDHLAPHGLGDQLAVHAQDLARCLAAIAADEVAFDIGLESLAKRALMLRRPH